MRHHQVSGIMVASLVTVTFCCGFVLASSYVSADDSYNADISLTIPVACTMTGTVDTPHTANVEAGTYTADIGTTTLKTVCNDGNGFSIYAIGYSGLEYGNNKMIATVGGTLAPTYDIATGTAQNGNTSNWAMKLNAVTGTYAPTILSSFDSYHAVPDTYTKVATRASGTDATTGASIQSTYAVYVTSLQPAGSYNGKVRYTLVHPNTETPLQPVACTAGKICYNANGGNVEGTMGKQNINDASSVILLASNFSRDGYGFAGWSTTFDYSDSAGLYGPQGVISIPSDASTNGVPLYAIWVKSTGNFQGWTGCSGLASGAVTALTDQRDNETYAVAKLADGNCWMIENLRLENNAAHNSDGALAQGYGTSITYGNFSGLAEPEMSGFTNTYSANSLYYSGTQEGTATIDIGTTNAPAYRMPRYNNLNTPDNVSNRPSNPTSNTFDNDNTAGMYSYGNYYTWHAAVADLTYSMTRNSSFSSTSLCPLGWRLPKGGNKARIESEDDSDFWNLIVSGINGGTLPANYESSTTPYFTGSLEASRIAGALRRYPNNFLYSGFKGNSSVSLRGSFAFYWSSTVDEGTLSYGLYLNSTNVYPGTGSHYTYNGASIRCLISN